MEICQHCGMYMKPFKQKVTETHGSASCEFCAEVIADWYAGKGWVRVEPLPKEDKEGSNQKEI